MSSDDHWRGDVDVGSNGWLFHLTHNWHFPAEDHSLPHIKPEACCLQKPCDNGSQSAEILNCTDHN